jgi:hypothetical protein
MKKPMKFKRYDEGGEVEESKAKQRGLDISNKDAPMGFFERLRMGNIDDPTSEAYKRLGAGRGRSEAPAEKAESAPEAPAKIIPRPSIQMRPTERALSDDMYSDYGNVKGGNGTGTGEAGSSYRVYYPSGTAPSKPMASKPMVKKEVGESVSVNQPLSKREVGESVSVNQPKTTKKSAISPEEMMEADNPKGRSPFSEKPKETQKPKTQKSPSLTAFPKNEEPRRMMSEGVGKAISGATSGIVDYFSGLKSTPERKAQNRKMEKLKADPTSRERDLSKGGSVSSASRRADGIATKGKTRGKMC